MRYSAIFIKKNILSSSILLLVIKLEPKLRLKAKRLTGLQAHNLLTS